jgi:hypothetical protein
MVNLGQARFTDRKQLARRCNRLYKTAALAGAEWRHSEVAALAYLSFGDAIDRLRREFG